MLYTVGRILFLRFCLEKIRLFPDAWAHFYAEVFSHDFISIQQDACIRCSIHEHASSSWPLWYHSSMWRWGARCGPKGHLSGQLGKQSAAMCCSVCGRGMQEEAKSLGRQAACGPILTQLEDVIAVVSGIGMGGQGHAELLILHRAADFTRLLMRKIQNKQTQNFFLSVGFL